MSLNDHDFRSRSYLTARDCCTSMLDHAHASSHVNISYAYFYVNFEIQIYNEDKSWS